MLRERAPALALLLALGSSGCAVPTLVGATPSGAPIVKLPLSQSSAYLVRARRHVLVDAGTLGDHDELERDLAQAGSGLAGIRLVIVTHAHHDHAGLAAELQRDYGARIMLGEGDVAAAQRGEDDELHPTGVTGIVLKPLLAKVFPPFAPDIVVRGEVDLRPWGIDGRVVPMAGHTPGSLAVVLDNHRAFVGDQMLGGWLGGALFASRPGEHYYQADPAANHRNIAALLGMGVETFYLGHGGPVPRRDVLAAFP